MFSLHKISVLLLFVFLSLTASGGNPYYFSGGAIATGMGSVCVTGPGFWNSFRNQALLTQYPKLSIGFNYLNRFNIRELGTRTAGLIIPAGTTSLGILYSHFGYSEFRREITGLACGVTLSENISAGVQIDYLSEKKSGEYENHGSLTCEAGLFIKVSEKISAGIHIFNPVPNSVRNTFMTSTLTAGAGIDISPVLYAAVEVEMNSGQMPEIRSGFDYEAVENLWIRGGFSTRNTSFTLGIGYLMKTVKLDLGFATHEKLGVTSGASLIFLIR